MANPATLRYVRDVALPYATDHGIELHELRKVRRDGTVETLHGRLVQPGSRSLPIPVRMPDTGAPAPAPARWISRSGSLAAGSASTAPAGPTPPPSPSGSPPTKSTAPTANAPNRGRPPTTRCLSSGCPGPTARPSLPAPDFQCPRAALATSVPSTGLTPGRGCAATNWTCSTGPWPSNGCSTTAAPACAAQPAATLRWSMSSTATTTPAMTPWCPPIVDDPRRPHRVHHVTTGALARRSATTRLGGRRRTPRPSRRAGTGG
jgi:hypothetical protein